MIMSVIKQETILSVFGDDKVTLLEWIKKVYKTLEDGALTDISVNRVDAGHIEIIFTFADGTTQSSGLIDLGSIDLATLSTLIEGNSSEIDVALNSGGTALKLSIDSGVMDVINNALVLPQNAPAKRVIPTITTGNVQENKDYDTHESNLTVSGDLAVNGAITGNSIVENMSDYSILVDISTEGRTITPIYCGICKNGNKLTIALFFKVNKSIASPGGSNLMSIYLPADIGEKIYPYTLGGFSNLVDYKRIDGLLSTSNYETIFARLQKASNTRINFGLDINELTTLNTDYLFRYECTFLLSDNLAGN